MENTILGKITIITISIVKLTVLENCRGKPIQKYSFKHTKQHQKHFVQPLKLMQHTGHQPTLGSVLGHCVTKTR